MGGSTKVYPLVARIAPQMNVLMQTPQAEMCEGNEMNG